MPLLMCPNCQTGTKQINRENVQIDMCPQCHGVWLDRGELQKLLEVNRADMPAYQAAPESHRAAPSHQQHAYRHDDDDDYHRHGKHRKKSRMDSIFDIFD